MPATREADPNSGRRTSRRRRPLPVALSLAVHLALLYVLTRVPMPVSEAHVASPIAASVVWLRELPAREAPPAPPEPQAAEPPPKAVAPPPPKRTTPAAPKRPAARKQPEEPAAPLVEAQPPERTEPPPRIDWDKEREAAVRHTIENPGGPYRTIGPTDIPERKRDPLPVEPAPTAMQKVMSSRCAIYKNRFQAALLGMVGVCTRDAAGGLFAGARTPQMDEHPVCRETRPDSPGAVASDGRVISTVKCELVADDDEVTEVKVDVDLDALP